jgi:hypothetical protein
MASKKRRAGPFPSQLTAAATRRVYANIEDDHRWLEAAGVSTPQELKEIDPGAFSALADVFTERKTLSRERANRPDSALAKWLVLIGMRSPDSTVAVGETP